MQALNHKIPPPVVAGLIAVAMWAVSSFQPAIPFAPLFRQVAVSILAVAGICFDSLGLLAFLKSRTTVNPLSPHKASALVTGGIYQITRNPMYVGLALLLGAWAVHLTAMWPFIGPILFVAYINRYQIESEERVLTGIFGDEYSTYAAQVRRWL
ncbi:MAG: isoprenylcysteine carboxylmethyltransferase family protein [Sideroxyarcus sp.]